jgi:hypothetical protein
MLTVIRPDGRDNRKDGHKEGDDKQKGESDQDHYQDTAQESDDEHSYLEVHGLFALLVNERMVLPLQQPDYQGAQQKADSIA